MSFAGIFVLTFAMLTIRNVQSQECDSAMCNIICHETFNTNGTCAGNECDCYYGKHCSEMASLVCDKACEIFHLKGKCDEKDRCICKAELAPCSPTECQEQCEEDPRGIECKAIGGIVIAVACLEYGPIKTCGCLCQHFKTSKRTFKNWRSSVSDGPQIQLLSPA